MDIICDLKQQIAALPTGGKFEISAQSLLMSRADFHSIRVYLTKEAESGHFSILQSVPAMNDTTSMHVIKH